VNRFTARGCAQRYFGDVPGMETPGERMIARARVMKLKHCLSGLGSALALSLMLAAPANAQACSYRMGPYLTQYAAEAAAQQVRDLGYAASGVWGEGGVISQSSNRRYFFNVFYEC